MLLGRVTNGERHGLEGPSQRIGQNSEFRCTKEGREIDNGDRQKKRKVGSEEEGGREEESETFVKLGCQLSKKEGGL